MPNMSANEIAEGLARLAEQFRKEPKRAFSAPWSDWPGGCTSCHVHPVVYAIWAGATEEVPLYVGHTTGLGPRLASHFKSGVWSRPPTHVSFVQSEAFRDDAYRTLAERFLILALDPTDNDRSR
jgi:hypothetical protein